MLRKGRAVQERGAWENAVMPSKCVAVNCGILQKQGDTRGPMC